MRPRRLYRVKDTGALEDPAQRVAVKESCRNEKREQPIKRIEGASSKKLVGCRGCKAKRFVLFPFSLVLRKVRNLERRAEVESILGSSTRPILAVRPLSEFHRSPILVFWRGAQALNGLSTHLRYSTTVGTSQA